MKILSQSNSIMGWKAAPAPPATFTDIVLDDCPSLFVAVEGLTGYENTVSFQIPDNDDLYVRLHEGALVLEVTGKSDNSSESSISKHTIISNPL